MQIEKDLPNISDPTIKACDIMIAKSVLENLPVEVKTFLYDNEHPEITANREGEGSTWTKAEAGKYSDQLLIESKQEIVHEIQTPRI